MQSEKKGCSSDNSDTGHIIESLPDTDFYKFTMEQIIFDKGIYLSYRLSDK
jgi:nicotinic acid phosphoribosyltransferase